MNSRSKEPLIHLTKRGAIPTEPNARTGELTPPGIHFFALSNSVSDTDIFLLPVPAHFILYRSGLYRNC